MLSTTHGSLVFVLVHGAWHDGRVWDRVTPLLQKRGHRVLTPSLTGHGETAHLLTPDVGLDTYVQDVTGLIVDADLTDVVLVGHSYAGLVVASAANRVPTANHSATVISAVGRAARKVANGGADQSGFTVSMLVYQQGFKFFNLGYASAAAYTLFIFIVVLAIVQFRLLRTKA